MGAGAIPLLNDLAVAAPEEGGARQLIVKRTSMAQPNLSRLQLHRHPYYEIFWYRTGGGVVVSDFDRLKFEAPALVVVPAGRLHTSELRPETAGWLVAFSADVVQEESEPCAELMSLPLFASSSHQLVSMVRGSQAEEMTRLYGELLREYEGHAPWRDLSLRSALRLLLIKCARLFSLEEPKPTDAPAMITRRFQQELEESFLEVRQVRDYASRLGLSPQRLIQCVRERMGRTPGELIAERVLAEARRLLFHTPQTVAEIAYALKFKDPSHFGHFFRRHCGCTPRMARLCFARRSATPQLRP